MENMKSPTCLHCIVNEHGSFVVFLSKCLDLIVVYVLQWGSSNAAAWRKKIIRLKQEKSAKQSKDLLLPSEPTNTGQ